MTEREIELLFSRDGLIHPVYPSREAVIKGRRDLWSEDTYRDAAVCLTCTAEECDGEPKCFRRRAAYLAAAYREAADLPAGTLLDDLIYADEVCEDGGRDDLPWE